MTKTKYLDAKPTPRMLQMLGEIPLKGWQCVAEFIDNSIDGISDLEEENDNAVIDVYIPSPGEIKDNVPISIKDNGAGMTVNQLEKSIRAGYSGKFTDDKLGLFGMGFNVASARIGNKAQIWTTTKDDNREYGVTIDLNKMVRDDSYKIELKNREKTRTSGTEVFISNYKKDSNGKSKVIGNRNDIIRELDTAYSESLFNHYKITVNINGNTLEGKRFCTWDREKRYITYKGERIVPFVSIPPTEIKTIGWCTQCLTENNLIGPTRELPEQCYSCDSIGQIIKKSHTISGWLGIQRFFDNHRYGVDVVRKGRIIIPNLKSIFYWEPREKHDLGEDELAYLQSHPNFDGKILFEYPRDNTPLGGRIVGEIYADYIHPTYTKDNFNQETESWKDVIEHFRGEVPLQPEIAKKHLKFPTKNYSPLSRLFNGYRSTKVGAKTLVCASPKTTTPSQGNELSINYYYRFLEGDPDYQDDEKWYELVMNAERKKDPTERREPEPEPDEEDIPEDDENDPFYGPKKKINEIKIDLESKTGRPPKDYIIYEWTPVGKIVFQPIICNHTTRECHVYLNQQHDMMRNFSEGWEDLLAIEVAHDIASKCSDNETWTVTSVYYEIKNKYFSYSLLDPEKLIIEANRLTKDIITELITKKINLRRRPTFSEEQLKNFRASYNRVNNKAPGKTSIHTKDTSFLRYMDKSYIFDFLDFAPYCVLDNNFFIFAHEDLDMITKQDALRRFEALITDLKWIIMKLPELNEDQGIDEKASIIKAKLSFQELLDNRVID